VSWLLLGGRCRDCATAVPVRYPLIEAGTGLLFAALAAAYGPVAVLPALLYLAATGVALSVIDLEHHRLPDVLVLPAYPVLAVLLLAPDPAAAIAAAPRTLLSAGAWLAGYGGLWWLTAGRGMGRGDVKLSGLLGLVLGRLGWGPSVLGLFGGFAVGAAVAVVLLATGRADRRTRLAHGPFMLVGAAVAVFAGDQLWTAWLDFAAQG
jgi:leader peptidase (prepilin peptidase)/N-methyltransferase